jgi:thiamine-phosphate pyrophosphorylase
MPKRIGRLHVLTDYFFQQKWSHAELAEAAMRGGADTIQFRQKHGLIRHRFAEAVQVLPHCNAHGVPLIVNDDIGLFLACEAHGIHVGQNDMPIGVLRRILAPDVIIGATATTTEYALRAQDEGADYIGFGPVFPTKSKANPESVKGLRGLERVCRAVSIPVIAIAGLSVDRVADCLAAGAHGIAVMTAISTAPDPEAATRAFRMQIDKIHGTEVPSGT